MSNEAELLRLADSLEAIAVFSSVDSASYSEMNEAASVLRKFAADASQQQPQASCLPPEFVMVPKKITPEIEAAIKEVAPKWYAPSVWGSLLDAAAPQSGETEA